MKRQLKRLSAGRIVEQRFDIWPESGPNLGVNALKAKRLFRDRQRCPEKLAESLLQVLWKAVFLASRVQLLGMLVQKCPRDAHSKSVLKHPQAFGPFRARSQNHENRASAPQRPPSPPLTATHGMPKPRESRWATSLERPLVLNEVRLPPDGSQGPPQSKQPAPLGSGSESCLWSRSWAQALASGIQGHPA